MKTVTKIALISLLWLIVINSGNLGSLDTELRLQMSHAWWTGTEEVQLKPGYKLRIRGDIKAGIMGVDGKRYIAYEQGQSLLMLPGDWVGTQLHQFFPTIPSKEFRSWVVNFLIFIPLNVAVVVSCFWLLRLFEFEERIAGLTSILFLLGTTVLHYAQVNQHNNQVLLLTTIGYAAALAYVRRDRPFFAWLSGLALGGSVLIRITSVIHGLTVIMFLAGCLAYKSRDKLKVFRGVGIWILGFIPFTLLGRILDYSRYGSFLATGKSVEKLQLSTDPMWSGLPDLPANYPFINPPHVGIFGPLFSPAKSLFLYDPFLLPCLILGIILWKRFSPYIQWYLVTAIFNLAIHLALYCRFFEWGGDAAWAARYHVTSVHLLLIPLLGLFVQRLISFKGLKLWLIRGIVTIAIIVQLASVTMPYNLEVDQNLIGAPGARLKFRLLQRMTNIVCLVDSSFSSRCVDRLDAKKKNYLKRNNYVFFLPFRLQRQAKDDSDLVNMSRFFFVVWGLALTLAIATTIQFGFQRI
ncbi:MAG: hypothetical protein F6K10_12550 [Moorea sp. SIO2B7]|nr:hypothetical protein [Moorena sp. SIO2B7]